MLCAASTSIGRRFDSSRAVVLFRRPIIAVVDEDQQGHPKLIHQREEAESHQQNTHEVFDSVSR
jgi:hypothetical protein